MPHNNVIAVVFTNNRFSCSEAIKAANIELSSAPAELKCELSHTLLREAVSMPCCNRLVNDSIIRDTLVREGLKCPFCNTPRISPESVSAHLFRFRFIMLPTYANARLPCCVRLCLVSLSLESPSLVEYSTGYSRKSRGIHHC